MDKELNIKKWLEGNLDDREREEFEKTDDFKAIDKISKSLIAFKAPTFDIPGELERFHNKKGKSGKEVKIGWLYPLVRVAAVIFLVIGSFFYFYLSVNTSLSTLAGVKNSLLLPDSSKIELNASSQISYKKRLWNINRKVTLDGEAFFSVAKGSSFNVKTSTGIVSVLGTQFNVKNRENYFEVICYEGLVQVRANGENTRLDPGHSYRIMDGKASRNKDSKEPLPGWINNESFFKSVPFINVILELERQYDIQVEISGINKGQLFTGKFVHEDLNLALQAITIPFNLKYNVLDKKHVILSGSSE